MKKNFFEKTMDKLRYGFDDENKETASNTAVQKAPKKGQIGNKSDKNIATPELKIGDKNAITPKSEISNIVELNEIGIQAIINTMSAIKYSNVRLSEIHFHLRYGKQAPISLAVESLFNGDKFMENLKYKLTGAGIKYTDDIKVKINYSSVQVDNFTKLAPDLSIQTFTLEESKKLQKLIITALTGILWENEIELAPRKKPYFIGRCKMPELDKSAIIVNDIAFVGPEENPEPQYEINRFVSRSIAKIIYNENTGNFELMRSNLINNKQHVIKIIRISNGVQSISINNTEVGYPLQTDDQIVFNDKVALMVNIAEMNV